MDKIKITKAIIELASQILKKTINSNSLKASLIFDLGADSLDIVELIMAIEKEFSIEFPDSINNKLNTLQDIIDNTINYLEINIRE